ncbi:MAG: YihY/virulence factor BrkB family protein [Actinomycetota bacterium]|nr:YihY/virulence factor BrkB family protein [Actinomycetota bacterium]MDZ4177851.1 YihY/virulence factor BrkB family protein [Coriobacteriia bacterium]
MSGVPGTVRRMLDRASRTRAGLIAGATFTRFADNHGTTLAAALTLFLLLTVAPLVLVALTVAGRALSDAEARDALVAAFSVAIGAADETLVAFVVDAVAGQGGSGTAAIALAVALYGATGAFAEFRTALGRMWEAEPVHSGLRAFLHKRAFAFLALLLSGGTVALAIVLLSFAAVLGGLLLPEGWRTGVVAVLVNDAVGLALATAIFAVIYRVLPVRRLPWRDILVGALVTASLVTVGRMALGFYFSFSRLATVYGAVGSFLVVLIWLYYTAQVVLIGAQFTYVWSIRDTLEPSRPAEEPGDQPSSSGEA